MSQLSEGDSMSDSRNINNKVKSELFHIWKKARIMYDMVKEDSNIEDWVKKNITKAYELIDEATRYEEYQKIFPNRSQEPEESEQDKNNFLSNQDKRYPLPSSQETGDQFVTRCILDANMKKRYPVQSDRFHACMKVFNENSGEPRSNPGEKFDDPMQVKDSDIEPATKPLLP